MTTTPFDCDQPEDTAEDIETTKSLLLSLLRVKDKKGEGHCFPWSSEKEIKELSKEGLVYLNRQTENGIYAKLTDLGRAIRDYPVDAETKPKATLPPKEPTMRDLLRQGFVAVAEDSGNG